MNSLEQFESILALARGEQPAVELLLQPVGVRELHDVST